MAYQFVRIETYCPKLTLVPGTVDQYNSTEQVFAEVDRDPRYSVHVPDPAPPIPLLHFGEISVAELRKLHDEHRAAIRETVSLPDGRTYVRGLKSDFPTLYTEIHSHPMTAKDYRNASPEEKERVEDWARIALQDFAARIPKGVKFASVLHLDEGHVHFHILAVNMDDPKMSANKLHVGKVAAEEWRQEHGRSKTLTGLLKPEPEGHPKKPKKPKPSKNRVTQKKRDAEYAAAVEAWEEACARIDAGNADALSQWKKDNNTHLRALRKARKKKVDDVDAYEAALVAFQDRYYEAVGRRCGLLRNGPGTERLSTTQYAARKAQAKRAAANIDHLREWEDALRTRGQKQDVVKVEVDAAMAALRQGESELAARLAGVAQREAAVLAREQSVATREQDLLKKADVLGWERQRLALEVQQSERRRDEALRLAAQAEVQWEAAMAKAEAVELGLKLIAEGFLRKKQVPDADRRELRWTRAAPYNELERKTLMEKLDPGMSIIEIMVVVIEDVLADLNRPWMAALARDAETLLRKREELGMEADADLADLRRRYEG